METYLLAGGAVLAAATVLIFVMSPAASRSRSRTVLDKQFVQNEWQKIMSMADKPDKSARYAIIEADKLLDYVLKARGYGGQTMGERLRAAGSDFSYRDDVWNAHKLRNKLVHESDYETDPRLISRAVKQFRQALKDMGAL